MKTFKGDRPSFLVSSAFCLFYCTSLRCLIWGKNPREAISDFPFLMLTVYPLWYALLPLDTVSRLSPIQALNGVLRSKQRALIGPEANQEWDPPVTAYLSSYPGLSSLLLSQILDLHSIIMASLTFKRKIEVIPFNLYQTKDSSLLYLSGSGCPCLPRRIKSASWSFYLKENNSSICSIGNLNIWRKLVSLQPHLDPLWHIKHSS